MKLTVDFDQIPNSGDGNKRRQIIKAVIFSLKQVVSEKRRIFILIANQPTGPDIPSLRYKSGSLGPQPLKLKLRYSIIVLRHLARHVDSGGKPECSVDCSIGVSFGLLGSII